MHTRNPQDRWKWINPGSLLGGNIMATVFHVAGGNPEMVSETP